MLIKGIICLVISLLLGFCMIFFPEILWKIKNILWVKNGEPTDFYIGITRAIGTLIIVIDLVVVLIVVLLHFDLL